MKTQLSKAQTQQLYEKDFYLWLQTTVEQMHQQNLDSLDWEHLIEEIAELGNEQRRKVKSYLKQLLIHLLLYKYWSSERDYCAKGWEIEIDNFRDELEFLLESKTLYNYFLAEIENVYIKARKHTIKKTGLPSDIFPQECPFSAEQILNSDYFPTLNISN
ncbi:MAG: DUF29 domain-containing protein [Waterburya sp.]